MSKLVIVYAGLPIKMGSVSIYSVKYPTSLVHIEIFPDLLVRVSTEFAVMYPAAV